MTSNPAGIEPPLSHGNRVFPVPSIPTSSQKLQQAPRSWPRRNNAIVSSILQDPAEPALKKQKLNDTVVETSSHMILNPTFIRATSDRVTLSKAAGSSASRTPPDGQEDRVDQPPLIPLRPGNLISPVDTQRSRTIVFERATRKDAVPVKPYVAEVPPAAPQFDKAGSADFTPWTGNHSEDILNELTTKQGYYDKLQTSQSESNTARQSVWSALKQKNSIQVLSAVFVSALEQRQAHGTISGNSTFKPPPRVTLTDTKREAWLRDLANPLIPLRRLSRTIPYGIRGKILLEHCLSKDIPISRAIWLAKCVGANEIRAFKRKGASGVFNAGGEAKWIKDWTTNVEQFLESIMSTCGTNRWAVGITYGLRLISHLYTENLLDQEQYLNWLLRSLRDSNLDILPAWLQIMQVHEQQILQHRQYGKELAKAVLLHLHMAQSQNDREIFCFVSQQLTNIIKSIMSSSPSNLLIPDYWNQYQTTLGSYLNVDEDETKLRFESLARRNAALQSHSLRPHRQPRASARRKLIRLLDGLPTKTSLPKLASCCLQLAIDPGVLVRTCVEWSSSEFRHGDYRIYAAVRLLRIWDQTGIEVQQPILDFIAVEPFPIGVQRSGILRLLAELVSSKHFSVGRYLQWVMARGTLEDHHKIAQVGKSLQGEPLGVRLLFELPLHGLSCHVLNLRRMLVSQFGCTPEAENAMIIATKMKVADRIPKFFSDLASPGSTQRDVGDAPLSQPVKSATTRWVRQTLISRIERYEMSSAINDDSGQRLQDPDTASSEIVNLEQFQAIRRILEEFGDFAILADVLYLISTRARGATLTAVSDTVNYHFQVLDAIGAAEGLFHTMYNQLAKSCALMPGKAYLESLLDLGCRFSKDSPMVQSLRKKIRVFAPRLSAAACSPISDNMVEAAHSTELAFADEMDQILANGTNMDRQTLNRIFRAIADQLEKALQDSSQSVTRLSRLLALLRGFGENMYDTLLGDWLRSLVSCASRPSLLSFLPPLICSEVISLEVALDIVLQSLNSDHSGPIRASFASEVLELIAATVSEVMPIVDYPTHRMSDQMQRLIRTSPRIIIAVIQLTIDICTTRKSSLDVPKSYQIEMNRVQRLLQTVISQEQTNKGDNVHVPSVEFDYTRRSKNAAHSDVSNADMESKLSMLLNNVSDFNIAFVQLEIQEVLAADQSAIRILSDIFAERASTLTAEQSELWACVAAGLSTIQAATLRGRAESDIVCNICKGSLATEHNLYSSIHAMMVVVEATSFSVCSTDRSPIVNQITSWLTGLLGSPLLGTRSADSAELQSVCQIIDVCLRLLTIHRSTLSHPKHSQNILFQLLMALSLLLVHSTLVSHFGLSNSLFDTLTVLSDALTDDTRARCIHFLRDIYRTWDSRFDFIFGCSERFDSEWLQLTTYSSASIIDVLGGTASPATIMQLYPLRRWEMMQDATPLAADNDTSLSLTLFGAMKSVL